MKHVPMTATAILAGVLVSGSAMADVTPIGEFTGDAFEGFENIAPPGPFDGTVFGGQATMEDEFADPVIATNFFSGDGEVQLFPYDGNFMGLSPTGWTTFTFDTPVTQFGGFFGQVNDFPSDAVTFFDEQGQEIDSIDFDLPVGEWTWHGWESDVPIASIEILAGENPTLTTVYDNLQVTFVPAPGALALLAVGACAPRRRRR